MENKNVLKYPNVSTTSRLYQKIKGSKGNDLNLILLSLSDPDVPLVAMVPLEILHELVAVRLGKVPTQADDFQKHLMDIDGHVLGISTNVDMCSGLRSQGKWHSISPTSCAVKI